MTTQTISVVHRILARDANERVVLRSIHGSAKTIRIPMVGTMIAASSSGNGPLPRKIGTRFKRPNKNKKYHAGYGTNEPFVGSALASRNGGEIHASAMMIRNTTNDANASMNIWSGQKRPGLSFRGSSTTGPAGPL